MSESKVSLIASSSAPFCGEVFRRPPVREPERFRRSPVVFELHPNFCFVISDLVLSKIVFTNGEESSFSKSELVQGAAQ